MSNFSAGIKNTLITILIFSIYIVIIGGYFVGITHAFKKHDTSDGLLSVFLFAPAYYWSAEKFFFHKSEEVTMSDEFYENELMTDIKVFVMLCNEAANNKNSKESIEANTNLKLRFKNYPKKYQDRLKSVSRLYIQYILMLQSEVGKNFELMLNGTAPEKFQFSSEVNKIQQQLIDIGLEREVQLTKKGTEIVLNDLESSRRNKETYNNQELSDFNNSMKILVENNKFLLTTFYKDLYGETY